MVKENQSLGKFLIFCLEISSSEIQKFENSEFPCYLFFNIEYLGRKSLQLGISRLLSFSSKIFLHKVNFRSTSILWDIFQALTGNVQDQSYFPQVSICVAVSKDDVHGLKSVALSILHTAATVVMLCHIPQNY